jgi:hypothetical protein
MNKTKTIVLLIAASVLVAALAGIAFAQYASAQANGNNSNPSQFPQGTTGTNYPSPQQGYYPYGAPSQNGYPYGYGRGMGMCARFW